MISTLTITTMNTATLIDLAIKTDAKITDHETIVVEVNISIYLYNRVRFTNREKY